MTGHLDITAASDEGGRTYLARQSFCAPVHLSKPFQDEGTLVVNVVNPTAGLFAGDRIRLAATVESGARMLLTSPSASRAHRMEGGGEAEARVEQHYHVAAGGFLEVLPEWFIPQGGCRYRQNTRLEVERGGNLIVFESLAPGRVASGETFVFERLEWKTEAFFAGKQVVRERYRLAGAEADTWLALRTQFSPSYFLGVLLLGEAFAAEPPCLPDDEDWLAGSSRLAHGSGAVIRVLARDSVALRRAQRDLRTLIYATLGRPAPSVRRY